MANNFPTIRPTLNLQLANTGALPPDVTFTRASSSGGYYDGRTVVKAEENLFTNSVWAGAVSGTPGTEPSGWVFVTSGGSLTVSGESIEFFAAAGQRQSISQTLVVTAGQVITVSVDVDSVVGTASAAVVQLEPLSGTFTSTTNVVVSDGTGRKTASTTCTVGGTLRLRFGASVTIATADDCTVSMKAPQIEIRSAATAYTPTTTQPITNYIPKMLFAPANVPVFDHNPVTGEALGLSVWEARTNLILRSQEFDDAAWTKGDATIGANQVIAPDGTLTADKIVSDLSGVAPRVQVLPTLADNTIFTFSVFCKKGEWGWVNLVFRNKSAATDPGAWFNLTTGVVGTVSAGITASIVNVGNGFYRCVITASTFSGGATPTFRVRATNADNTLTTGDGFSGIYIWGAQLEAGAFATPYIPTVASTVARSADVAVMTGVNFSRWFNAAEGTFVVEGLSNKTGNARYMTTSNTSGDNRLLIYTDGASGITASATTNGVTQALLPRTGLTITNFNKFAFSYKTDDFAAVGNGGAVGTDTLGVVPPAATLHIGVRENGATQLSGHLKSLSYYPIALTDAQKQAVTA